MIPQAFELALQHHQAGRLAHAEALYRQILSAQPNHAGAMHFLGVIAHQAGRHDRAVDLIRQSIVLQPNNPAAYSNLGEAWRKMGRLDEAVTAFRHALELKPDSPGAHNNLGNALREQGQFDESIAACLRALELDPGFPEAHLNLGNAFREQGRLDEAIAAYRHACQLKPASPEASYNLGIALKQAGKLDESITAYRRALELKPDCLEARNNLGNALWERGQLDEAVAAFHRALELQPDVPETLNNLGNVLRERGQIEEAIAAYRRALQARPDSSSFHSNLVFALQFHPDHDGPMISAEHQRWNRQFSDPLRQLAPPHANHRDPDRPLRVGYVSPDFREHPVGRYLAPLFERHDRERFEILCYSGTVRSDGMTARLRALTGKWRSTVGISDVRMAEMIREDDVDILVDLSLHTAGNRLPVFARKPAPVQVAWLGYPGGAGLPGIDYRLTDSHMEPPREASPLSPESPHNPECDSGPIESRHSPKGDGGAWSAEEPVRLPDCWCCYDPAGESPEVHALPALSSGGVTFGSLNNFAKVHEGVLARWARVLEAVKGSRLVMLCPEGSARERVRGFFGARGIGTERMEFVGCVPRWDYLQLHQRIDLCLDPFPCNGMTTTCDALWMGVPVLTLPGDMPVSRAGLSLLSTVGLEEFATSSEEDYVLLAVDLATDLPRLANLRATLRPRMQSSPLMDAPRFARNVEAAYRKMWERWSLGNSPARND